MSEKKSVMILGGYGNFGKRIAEQLIAAEIPVIIAGRNAQKAEALLETLDSELVSAAYFDANIALKENILLHNPYVIINTCGPFQNADYSVAEGCIDCGVHYIDLADARDFVVNIISLHKKAQAKNVAVISGASSVPALSSAVVEYFKDEFVELHSLHYGISPGQKAERGLATTKGILSYVGKPFQGIRRGGKRVYGWQNLHSVQYPDIGKRWLANCDIPDLEIFPAHYNIKRVHFGAGLELSFMHKGLWLVSWLVRLGVVSNLQKHAETLLRISHWFDKFGSADGGMHVFLSGITEDGELHHRKWYILAFDGDGPYIPTIPAVLLAKKLISYELTFRGAAPCVGMITLDEYLDALEPYAITTKF